jgi:hypothetical protein
MNFKVYYNISSKLYALLNQNKGYYFEIMFPQKIAEILGEESSGLITGPTMEPNLLSYHFEFSIKLKKSLVGKEKDELDHREGYGLYVHDQDKDAVHYFEDIELYSRLKN